MNLASPLSIGWQQTQLQFRGWVVFFLAWCWFAASLRAQGQNDVASANHPLAGLQSALSKVIAANEKSVVAIARVRRWETNSTSADEIAKANFADAALPTSSDFVPQAFGSGIVVDPHGLILTSYHNLGELGRNEYYVWTANRPFPARVKAADPWLDVAILQIDAHDLTPVALGDAAQVQKGEFVVALGNPNGIARDGLPSAAWGIIANLGRQAPLGPHRAPQRGRETLHHYGTLLQTDLNLRASSSGGGLFNLRGELIGITTTYVALAGQDQEAGLAIPVDKPFRQSLETLKQGRIPDYGFLGIAPTSLALDKRQAGEQGAVVDDVVTASPAATAGLSRGDVITRLDDTPVIDDLHLIRVLSALTAGTSVTISYRHANAGALLVAQATLSKKFPETEREFFAEQSAAPWRGMVIDHATAVPNLREVSRFADPQGCVGILSVERDSPAWKAGLRSGQFISHVDGQRVAAPEAFRTIVQDRSKVVELRVSQATGAYKSVRIDPAVSPQNEK